MPQYQALLKNNRGQWVPTTGQVTKAHAQRVAKMGRDKGYKTRVKTIGKPTRSSRRK